MRLILAFLAIAVSAPALAETVRPISSAEFVRRAEPLMKKSMVTLMFSSEAKQLMKQLAQASEATRAKHDADIAAGRKPEACLPPKGKAKLEAGELIAHLKTLPAAQQASSLQVGFTSYAARKFPCPRG